MDYEDSRVAAEAFAAEGASEHQPAPAHDHDAEHDADQGAEHASPAHAEPDREGAVDGGQHKDRDAKVIKGGKHRKVDLSLGTQVGPDGKPTGAPGEHKEGKVADADKVSIIAGVGSELEVAPGATPTEDELFTRGSGQKVSKRSGTTATPNVSPAMVPDQLYIDGAPHAEDVRQGGLGDCYFMSCLLGLTQNDPGKLTSVMTMAGGDVGVTFQRFDAKSGAYKHVTIHTGNSLLTKKSKKGHVSLVGARMRIADKAKRTQYWAEVHGGTVEIHRRDLYETALWAPMMEKAYADFTQKYGNDGQGVAAGDKKKSGYAVIDGGGSVEDCYQMFYGAAATANTTGMTFTPGSDVVAGNLAALQDLLRYQAQKGNTAAGTTQTFMHARMSDTGAVTRGRDLIDQVTGILFGMDTMDSLKALFGETTAEKILRMLREIDRALLRTTLATLRTTLVNNLAGTATSAQVAKAADPVSTPDGFPHLWDDTMPAPFKHLRENLGILINLGDDSSPGRRQNYTSHAYQVRDVAIADKAGAPLAVTAATVAGQLANIDAEQSKVVMHNPHATNEPDLRGTGPADGKDDGIFTYTLGQFLRNFDLLRFANVAH